MTRRLATILSLFAFSITFSHSVLAQDPTRHAPQNAEPSIVGTWIGTCTITERTVHVTTTIRADKSYQAVIEYAGYVTVERGTYKYSDGILTTVTENSKKGELVVAFTDKDNMKVTGEGVVVTYKRK